MAAVERKVVPLDDPPGRRTRLGRPKGSTGSQIERNKRRLAGLVLLGWRNGQIAREFGVSSRTIRAWLDHPQVQEAIRELEEELHRNTERLFAGLFRASIRRMNKIIRKGDAKVALRAIELLWTANGHIARGKEGPEIVNQQVLSQPLIMDRADARAALALLKDERRRQEREKEITLDPGQ